MLRLEKVDAYYGESRVLRDISMEVEDGAFHCVLGRNGMGKSTLMKAIIGIRPPTKTGKIMLDNTDISRLPANLVARLGVAYIPQGRDIFPQLTVHENLKLALYSQRGEGERRIPEKVFDYFPIIRERLNQKAGTLSGGEQQMLALARGLAQEPKIMLLDEPTEGIQPNIVERLEDITARMNKEGITMLLVEQKLDLALRLSSKYHILTKGEIVDSGSTAGLKAKDIQAHLTI